MPRLLAFLALLLLVALFLPWLPGGDLGSGGAATSSGFDIVRGLVGALGEGQPDLGQALADNWEAWILLLIPVFGVLTLLLGLAGAGLASATAFLAGLPAVAVTVKGLLDEGTEVFQVFEIGAWVTLVVSVLLVLLAFVPRRRR